MKRKAIAFYIYFKATKKAKLKEIKHREMKKFEKKN